MLGCLVSAHDVNPCIDFFKQGGKGLGTERLWLFTLRLVIKTYDLCIQEKYLDQKTWSLESQQENKNGHYSE